MTRQPVLRRLSVNRWDLIAIPMELREHFAADEADAALQTVTNWGRYAEIYAYDQLSETFSLD